MSRDGAVLSAEGQQRKERSKMKQVLFVLVVVCIGVGVAIGHGVWGSNNYNCWFTTQFSSGESRYFWQEATKSTVDGKPVEITDVQVFYKYYGYDEYRGSPITCPPPRLFYGNITYYPGGIENSQTYVVPTPSPTPCAWQTERTSYSFCGKVTVNSSAGFDRLLKDIEKHSYHIQMGWMHLDYEYAHKTYDNTLPAPVNICMGIIPGDNFPIGSEWEGRMAYVIDECASLGSCDFDTLALIPTPTPVFAFPYEFCGNGCLICTDHLGNCPYIHGRPTPTPG
jgi:hypothetical protein